MRTIAVIARKGGSGKTTVAMHLALAAHLRGYKALVADTDPQRSALDVLKARRGACPEVVNTSGPKLFALQTGAVRDGVGAMIVDTAAGALEDMAHAIVLSDLSLLVLRPTFLDLAAAVQTVDVVQRLRKPAIVVVNQAPVAREGVETAAMKRVLQALKVMRQPVAPIILRYRSIYQTALETGRSAEEGSDAIAAQEMAAFWDFIERFAFAKRDGARGQAAAPTLAQRAIPAATPDPPAARPTNSPGNQP